MLLAISDFLRFLVTALVFLLLFIIGLLVGTFVADAIFSPASTNYTNLTYSTPTGATQHAYLNTPPGAGPYPGIILIADHWGLNDQMVHLTNVLGDAGYVVITPDIFHGTTSRAFHRALVLGRLTSRQRVLDDLDNAYAYLRQHNAVIADEIGVVGLGYGGGLALQYAAQNPQLAAAVNLYGPVPGDLGEFSGAVMGLFGSRDRLVRPNQAYRLLEVADAAGLNHQVEILNQLGNGFMRYPDIILPGAPANDAWTIMLDFLRGALYPPPHCYLPDLYYEGAWCG